MWRIGKTRPKELWEEEVQSPLGDIEAAEIIRVICRSAADSAARVGSPSDGAKQKSWDTTNQHARYRGAARRAMEIAMKISDELMRDAAVGEIVDLCLKANDIRTAKTLFRAIQAPSIREIVLGDHPRLEP